ncbi:hypothetical protein [Streptomyces bluensis]|uniref:hypothetical protein n=1 Tax=Streptomyces bluensis TaxID=33897 RepID=UPI0033241D11
MAPQWGSRPSAGHAVDRRPRGPRPEAHPGEPVQRLPQLWAPLLTWAMPARGAGVAVRYLDCREFGCGFTGPDTERSFVAGRPEVLPYLRELVAMSGAVGRGGASYAPRRSVQ